MNYLIIILYLICASSGQVLFKYGCNKSFKLELYNGNLNLNINIFSIMGLILYVISFVLFCYIMSRYNLSYIVPILTGVLYISVILLSTFILRESINTIQLVGIGVILFGVIIMNIRI